jgi:uncharacterized protein (DUF305 family)
MAFRVWSVSAAVLFLTAATAPGQEGPHAPIVQPGAPGHSNKVLTPEAAVTPRRAPTDADTYFMQGMIHHHSQAVEMTDLMSTRTHNKELLSFGKRISISQTDEMKYMKQWLEERGKPTTMSMPHMEHKPGMKMDMSPMGLMPGMLTREQMAALAKASGKTFDRLFLTGMMQHHGGALTMVQDLFETPGAGQDNVLFDFATDVDNTQRAEIEIMRGMLKEKK